MNRRFPFAIAVLFLLTGNSPCEGKVISISRNPSEWIVNEAHGWGDWTANFIKETSSEGNLRVTRTVANPGSGWAAHLRTAATYAFTETDMDYSVSRYKWRVNGLGTYSSNHGGPGAPQATHEQDPWLFGPTGRLTTEWSWAGSIVLADNVWVFTEVVINGDRTWTATTGYGGYGLPNPLTSLGGTISQTYYDALGDMYFRHTTADNYAPGQYFEIAEATIEIVPEPTTALILGLGGLALLRRRP